MKRKTSKKNSLPKYEFGSYVENPDMALYENEMAMMNANQKAQSNKWAKGFSMAGDMMMKNGSQMLSQGLTQGLSSMNPTSAGGKFMKGNANMFGDLSQNLMDYGQFELNKNRFALGGNVGGGEEQVKKGKKTPPSDDYIPATRKDSLNLQKNYLLKAKQLEKLGYRKKTSEDGSFTNAHAIMFKNFMDIKKKEKGNINTEIIQPEGYRKPGIYPSAVYREENINNNKYLYKNQEAEQIGVLNPNVPYSFFDTRIAPTKKDLWVNDQYNDGVTNYGYDFGEKYASVPKKKSTGTTSKPRTTTKPAIKKSTGVAFTKPADRMAMGGSVNRYAMGGNVPVEVEGNEVGEMPNGQLLNFEGPSHEQGGIPIALPQGTEIYSKRIKVDGVSMADRKNKREKKTMTLESLFEKNKTDALIKNSLNRTIQNNEMEESADNKIQQTVKQLLESQETGEFATGGKVRKPILPASNLTAMGMMPYQNQMPTADLSGMSGLYSGEEEMIPAMGNNFDLGSLFGSITPGDVMGMYGNAYQADSIMKTIMENRNGDTPNINAFKDYGQDGLKKMDESKQYLKGQEANSLKDLELARTGAIKRGRNSARSVNGMRALDLATDMGINSEQSKIFSNTASGMMNILGQESQLENDQDRMVMTGEQGRDLADRQDRDNFYSQLITGQKNIGETISQTGKDFNAIKTRNVSNKLVNGLSDYFESDISGNTKLKEGATYSKKEGFTMNDIKGTKDLADMTPEELMNYAKYMQGQKKAAKKTKK